MITDPHCLIYHNYDGQLYSGVYSGVRHRKLNFDAHIIYGILSLQMTTLQNYINKIIEMRKQKM